METSCPSCDSNRNKPNPRKCTAADCVGTKPPIATTKQIPIPTEADRKRAKKMDAQNASNTGTMRLDKDHVPTGPTTHDDVETSTSTRRKTNQENVEKHPKTWKTTNEATRRRMDRKRTKRTKKAGKKIGSSKRTPRTTKKNRKTCVHPHRNQARERCPLPSIQER